MSNRDTSQPSAVQHNGASPTEPTLARVLVQRFALGLSLLEIDVPRVLRHCGLDEAALERLPDRVPYVLIRQMYLAAQEVSGQHGIGLRVAEQVRPETWEMLGYVIRSSGTLGDALLRAGRYMRLVSDATELGLHVEGERALLLCRTSYAKLALPEVTEFILAAIATFGRHLSGVDLIPIEVRFAHAAPADTALHARVFRAPIRFRSPHDGLVLDAALLNLPIESRDPLLCELLERQVEHVIATLPEPRRFTRAVQDALETAIVDGNPAANRIAARLGVHAKTLARRLRSEGTSHRRLLESVRRELAERYLTVSDKTVSEVAFLLGYADPSAFHKAFRRWTGTAPDGYRRRARMTFAG